jgi:formylglycine-generating enzyme
MRHGLLNGKCMLRGMAVFLLCGAVVVGVAATPNNAAAPSAASPSTAKIQKAAKVLKLVNYQRLQGKALSVKATTELGSLFIKSLNPSNPEWNPQHPQWKSMGEIISADIAQDLPTWQSTAEANGKQMLLEEYAVRSDERDLDLLLHYFESLAGQRYLAFQAQIEPIELAGMRALTAGQPVSDPSPSESVLKERMRLLSMGMSMMIMRANFQAEERQHNETSGYNAMPILMQNAALRGGKELDALDKQFFSELAGFATFSDSPLAQKFYASFGPALMASGMTTVAALQAFKVQELAKYETSWRSAYESRVVAPANATSAGDITHRATQPMPKPGSVLKECPECPELIVVPGGEFDMGSPDTEVGRPAKNNFRANSESPVHRVSVKSFAIGKFEVTREQFSAFTKETGYGGVKGDWPQPAEFHQNANHPVVGLNAADADAYVRWLARKTGQPYRLPSESEWEYAARAGTTTSRYWGDSEDSMCQYENVRDATAKKEIPWMHDWPVVNCTDGYAFTAPVGSFKPNPFGLYDMLGNASEIVGDCIHDQGYVGAPVDGSAWKNTSGDCNTDRIAGHAMRGGSWKYTAEFTRAAMRSFAQQDRSPTDGLRVARSIP